MKSEGEKTKYTHRHTQPTSRGEVASVGISTAVVSVPLYLCNCRSCAPAVVQRISMQIHCVVFRETQKHPVFVKLHCPCVLYSLSIWNLLQNLSDAGP